MTMQEATAISERRAGRLVGIARSVYRYEARTRPSDIELKERLSELTARDAGLAIAAYMLYPGGKVLRSTINGFIGSTAMQGLPSK